MNIYINDLQDSIAIDKAKLISSAKKILRYLGKGEDLSIAFVNDKKISELNARFRGEEHPTDVLAFGMHKGNLLGDVVISTDAAIRQAPMYNSTVEKELALYLTHGILHLAGYNDEKLKDRKRMEAKQEEILNKVNRG